jgi:hypothetical protein
MGKWRLKTVSNSSTVTHPVSSRLLTDHGLSNKQAFYYQFSKSVSSPLSDSSKCVSKYFKIVSVLNTCRLFFSCHYCHIVLVVTSSERWCKYTGAIVYATLFCISIRGFWYARGYFVTEATISVTKWKVREL